MTKRSDDARRREQRNANANAKLFLVAGALVVGFVVVVLACREGRAPNVAPHPPASPAPPPLEDASEIEPPSPSGERAVDTCRVNRKHPAHVGEDRGPIKHRAPPAVMPSLPAPQGALATLGWPAPCSERSCVEPASAYGAEERIHVLDGDAWRVALDDSDCDIHIEMTDPGGDHEAARMIVEVPDDEPYRALRHAIDDLVFQSEGHRIRAHAGGAQKNLRRAIPLRVTGFAFWDGHHVCRDLACPHAEASHCSHGTRFVCGAWELHPVLELAAR